MQLNDFRVTSALLENVTLSVKLKTEDGADVDKTFRNLQLKDEAETVATFTVPNEPRAIELRLDAEVKNMSRNRRDQLSKSARFSLNAIDDSAAIAQLFCMPARGPTSCRCRARTERASPIATWRSRSRSGCTSTT